MLQGNALIAGRFVLKRHYADGASRHGGVPPHPSTLTLVSRAHFVAIAYTYSLTAL